MTPDQHAIAHLVLAATYLALAFANGWNFWADLRSYSTRLTLLNAATCGALVVVAVMACAR